MKNNEESATKWLTIIGTIVVLFLLVKNCGSNSYYNGTHRSDAEMNRVGRY